MGFVTGKLEKLCQGKKGNFSGYTIAGDWFSDINGQRGWVVQIVGFTTYSVVDGEIHESEIRTPGEIEDTTDIVTAPQKATLDKIMEQAISDAITQWEKEEGA